MWRLRLWCSPLAHSMHVCAAMCPLHCPAAYRVKPISQSLCNISCSSGNESFGQATIMPMTLDLSPSGSLDERLWVTMEPEKAVQR